MLIKELLLLILDSSGINLTLGGGLIHFFSTVCVSQ